MFIAETGNPRTPPGSGSRFSCADVRSAVRASGCEGDKTQQDSRHRSLSSYWCFGVKLETSARTCRACEVRLDRFGLARRWFGCRAVAALCCASFLSSASFLQRTPYFPTTPFLLLAPFLPPTCVSEPLVCGRFVGKAADIQPVLSRDHFDVLVGKLEIPGITQQRDAPRRRGGKLAEVLDQPVPLDLKYRLRRTHQDQDARAPCLPACVDDRPEKAVRFLNGLAAE